MFPDNKIAKSFQMGPNKIEYSITHYLGPYVKGLLVELLNQTPCLILSFEESLNKKTTMSNRLIYSILEWEKDAS